MKLTKLTLILLSALCLAQPQPTQAGIFDTLKKTTVIGGSAVAIAGLCYYGWNMYVTSRNTLASTTPEEKPETVVESKKPVQEVVPQYVTSSYCAIGETLNNKDLDNQSKKSTLAAILAGVGDDHANHIIQHYSTCIGSLNTTYLPLVTEVFNDYQEVQTTVNDLENIWRSYRSDNDRIQEIERKISILQDHGIMDLFLDFNQRELLRWSQQLLRASRGDQVSTSITIASIIKKFYSDRVAKRSQK